MTAIHRRAFVQDASAAALVTGFMADGGAARANAGPNDRIRVGCVGVGGRAGSLLAMFAAQPDVEIVALADIDSRRMPTAVERVKQAKGQAPAAHGDFRKLVDDKSIDALVVGTPDHWHAIPTILGCLAGKDVYVEKPDSHNIVEGQRMVAAAKKKNRIVQLGTQSRSGPHFIEAINFIKTGKLGRVMFAKAWESMKQGPIGRPKDGVAPEGVDYDMWIGPAPKRPFNPVRFHGYWRWFFDFGTGDLGNDGVHRIDQARWALAAAVEAEGLKLEPMPRKVAAFGGKWYFDDAQEWPDTLQVCYEYPITGKPDAARVLTYEMRIWAPYPYQGANEGVILYGDQGYIVIAGSWWKAFTPKQEVIAQGTGSNEGTQHVRNFLDCMRSRQRPNADLETIGHPSSVMCHAGNVSWRVGRTLTIDAATETFVGDAEANALRSRKEYRAPWTLPDV